MIEQERLTVDERPGQILRAQQARRGRCTDLGDSFLQPGQFFIGIAAIRVEFRLLLRRARPEISGRILAIASGNTRVLSGFFAVVTERRKRPMLCSLKTNC